MVARMVVIHLEFSGGLELIFGEITGSTRCNTMLKFGATQVAMEKAIVLDRTCSLEAEIRRQQLAENLIMYSATSNSAISYKSFCFRN